MQLLNLFNIILISLSFFVGGAIDSHVQRKEEEENSHQKSGAILHASTNSFHDPSSPSLPSLVGRLLNLDSFVDDGTNDLASANVNIPSRGEQAPKRKRKPSNRKHPEPTEQKPKKRRRRRKREKPVLKIPERTVLTPAPTTSRPTSKPSPKPTNSPEVVPVFFLATLIGIECLDDVGVDDFEVLTNGYMMESEPSAIVQTKVNGISEVCLTSSFRIESMLLGGGGRRRRRRRMQGGGSVTVLSTASVSCNCAIETLVMQTLEQTDEYAAFLRAGSNAFSSLVEMTVVTSISPTSAPTASPIATSSAPTPRPTVIITSSPVPFPTPSPTVPSTNGPTFTQTFAPTPTQEGTQKPTPRTTVAPTRTLTFEPTLTSTIPPTPTFTVVPTPVVTLAPAPTLTVAPSPVVTLAPAPTLTGVPTVLITSGPTPTFTAVPSPASFPISTQPSPSITLSPSSSFPPSQLQDGPPQPKSSQPTLDPSLTFSITLLNMGDNTDYDAAFQEAKERWETIVIGDLPDVPNPDGVDVFQGEFLPKTYTGDIEDVVIGYKLQPIDGPGDILGSAGPLFFRNDFTSAVAKMEFDSDDFELKDEDDIKIIVLHEMGHALGIGTQWTNKCGIACKDGDFSYTCPFANEQYLQLDLGPGNNLALENEGGEGTACSHWDEQSFMNPFSSELMTGTFESEKLQPLSAVTIASLEDISYEVDYSTAEDFPADPFDFDTGSLFVIPKPTTSFVLNDDNIIPTNPQPIEKLLNSSSSGFMDSENI